MLQSPSALLSRLLVLVDNTVSALVAGKSTTTRVLAESLTSRFQTMSPPLIDGTGTAATAAGKTVTVV
jgi:hypothetical protein